VTPLNINASNKAWKAAYQLGHNTSDGLSRSMVEEIEERLAELRRRRGSNGRWRQAKPARRERVRQVEMFLRSYVTRGELT